MKLINKINNLFVAGCKYVQHKNMDNYVDKLLKIASFSEISQTPPTKFKRIIIVTPFMSKHSGGLTSVLRIAKRLSDKGVDVFFVCPVSDDCVKMEENAKSNLSSYTAKYITWTEAQSEEFDFVIPVQDIMVYYARKLKGYMVYFVQDYEPYFNPVGDRYFLSKKSLELGEDIISLGDWNLQEIKKNIDVSKIGKLYSVEFPFESSEYPFEDKSFNLLTEKKEINIAVYTKREPKRIPGIVMCMLEMTKKELENRGFKLNIYYFGLHKIEKPKSGINLGKVSKSTIRELYSKCDFGFVASMTNISLVPYEMIGSGLPVFEFNDGSYPAFLGKDTAILLNSFDYKEFVDKMLYYKTNPDEIEKLIQNGKNKIKSLSWDKTGQQFYDILQSIVKGK